MEKFVAVSKKDGATITKGKSYSIIYFDKVFDKYGRGFTIKDDENEEAHCLEFNCAHIGGNNWEIKEAKPKK